MRADTAGSATIQLQADGARVIGSRAQAKSQSGGRRDEMKGEARLTQSRGVAKQQRREWMGC